MHVAIEANIGAGKSTIMTKIRDHFLHVAMYQEPIEAWDDALRLFYTNKSRWSFMLQMRILYEYLSPRYSEAKDVITERCAYSSRYVFGQTLFSEGSLSENEWRVYKEYYDAFDARLEPDVIIYLKTDPKTCLERIQKRARSMETSGITLEYLQKLNFQYETMMKYFKGKVVHVIDGTKSENEVYKDVVDVLTRIYGLPKNDKEGDEVQK
jgi:deoxyadenosine/deoxycytidine kinase